MILEYLSIQMEQNLSRILGFMMKVKALEMHCMVLLFSDYVSSPSESCKGK